MALSTGPLPTARAFLDSLITELSTTTTITTTPPLRLPAQTQTLLLTLHSLFPQALLPALDLVDRRLITRVRSDAGVYYVCSAARGSWYEVRLGAWNCSCAGFAFAVFGGGGAGGRGAAADAGAEEAWFGGRLLDAHAAPPVCKHLLACVVVERFGAVFGEGVGVVGGDVEEVAGRAAGW